MPDAEDLVVNIVSIWPVRLGAHRNYRPLSKINRSGSFLLEPGSRTKPSILAVGPFSEPVIQGHRNIRHESDSTRAYHVAKDLINEWAENMAERVPGGAKPGIWITAIEKPTVESILASDELPAAIASENRFCEAVVDQARELYMQEKQREITRLHYLCADIINVKGEPWQGRQPGYSGQMGKCPFCAVVIPSTVSKCPNCKEIINVKAYERVMAQLKGQVDQIDVASLTEVAAEVPKPLQPPVPNQTEPVRLSPHASALDLSSVMAAAASEAGAGKKK